MKYLALREEVQGHMLDILLNSPQDDYLILEKMLTINKILSECQEFIIINGAHGRNRTDMDFSEGF